MATKKLKKTATMDEDLENMLETLGEEAVPVPVASRGATKGAVKGAVKGAKITASQTEEDILAGLEDLENLAPTSRPHTPRIQSMKRTDTPPPASSTNSEEKASATRKSGESTRSFHTSFTPSVTNSDVNEPEKRALYSRPSEPTPSGEGGGWWGSVFATASAAVKTAEAAMKEIQQNEEAKRWAEQVKGNVGALRGLGGQLSSRALPTFTNILHTLAPPISSHERLQIHITHDMIGYPSLDPLIYSTFSRVMTQVEGGDLLVIQRGNESTARQNSETGFSSGSGGWNDGPWWRQSSEYRDLGAVNGLIEGTKLVRVSAESYSNEYFSAHGGLDLAAQRATENVSESNPVRTCDIFLAVQAISHDAPVELFQGPLKEHEKADGVPKDQGGVIEDDEVSDQLISFAVYLNDPVHSITFATVSQAVPAKWIRWLNAPSQLAGLSAVSPALGEKLASSHLPEEIREIISNGGVDPREWVSEWVEETLSLSTGILAQRYVARRMGVDEAGLGKGKGKVGIEEVLGDGGGEAARAGLI